MPNKYLPKKPSSYIFKSAPKHDWSPYQKAIFKNIASENGHLIINAFAGSAKTSSIIEGFRYIPKGKKTLALAFNKRIQEELQARSPSYILPLTFHSLGLRAIRLRFGEVEIDNNKVFNIVKDQLGDKPNLDLVSNISDTVSYCKYGLYDTPNHISELIDQFDVDLCEMDRQDFIKLVVKTLGLDKAMTSIIDFDDMCWFPFVYNLPVGSYDYVFIDEFQDANKSQLVLAKKACRPETGRIIFTGDIFQAIYSWRLADTSIFESVQKMTTTKTLQLPISYRCPKSVIELAKKWVPDITCPETAIEGEVKDTSLNQLYQEAKPGCFILSRTNAPLIKICMSLIRKGIRANIRGRDVGKQLNYLIKKSKLKQIPAFLKWLDKWKDEEVARLKEKGMNPENVLDRVECLTNLCEECSTLQEVSKKISEMFDDSDEKGIVQCSSVHRSKGLEADDVFVLRWTFRVWFDQMQYVEKPNEEGNIAYVACSRSRKRLFIVHKTLE